MMDLDEAKLSLKRVTFTEEQRDRSNKVWLEAAAFLEVLFVNARPSPELTLACRALEECVMWHSKAISNESKSVNQR